MTPQSQSPDALDAIRIKNPCTVGWETMSGDDRARHCSLCRLNVYNIADMTRAEALDFIASREGGACVRIFRRPDGRVLTRDCADLRPTLRRRLRRRAALAVFAFIAVPLMTVLYLGGSGTNGAFDGTIRKLKQTRFYRSTKLGKAGIDWLETELESEPVMMTGVMF